MHHYYFLLFSIHIVVIHVCRFGAQEQFKMQSAQCLLYVLAYLFQVFKTFSLLILWFKYLKPLFQYPNEFSIFLTVISYYIIVSTRHLHLRQWLGSSGEKIQKLVAINISVKCNNFFRVLQWLYLFLDGTSHLDLPPAIPILFANSEKK